MKRLLLLVFGVALWCSCSSDDGTNGNEAAFLVDSLYARIVVSDDNPCTSPCARTELAVRHMFRRFPGTIDQIAFHPLESRLSQITFMDYAASSPPNVWYTANHWGFFPDDFEGVDTAHVEVRLHGAFWGKTVGLNMYQWAYYGDFTYADTLSVPIERPGARWE